ncbi:MAG: hypothetical protein ACLSAP_04030 [Oscillospiraceae bacterium]
MTCETWNQVYLRLKALLRQAGIENDAGEAGALFEEAFGANRRDLLLHGGRAADPAATARLFKLADRGRAAIRCSICWVNGGLWRSSLQSVRACWFRGRIPK